MLCAGLFAGCGQSDTKQDKAAGTESAKQAETKDGHGTNYSSAINIVNHGIDLKYSKPYLDFGPG